MTNYAIILAGGKGERFKSKLPKQFIKIDGKPILSHTVDIFENHNLIDKIIVVSHPDWIQKIKDLQIENNWKKVEIIKGGKTRQESSFNAIMQIKEKEANILIHDAVRPFLKKETITKLIDLLKTYQAIDVAIPASDTIIKVKNNFIEKIPNRKFYWRGQTPQAFKLSLIKKAHLLAKEKKDNNFTDDCGIVQKYNLSKIYVLKGDEENIKITYKTDLLFAEKLFYIKKLEKIENTNIKNKVGIIFGGNSGIGKEIAKILKPNNSIYTFSRKNGVDITNHIHIVEALKKVYKKESKIDFVIVTSAILIKKELMNLSYEEIINQINVNYISNIIIAKESFKYLKKTQGHLIFFTSSSYTKGRKEYSVYTSTKAAITNFMQAIAEEWRKYNIKVNAISPERTLTDLRIKNFNDKKEDLLEASFVAKESIKILDSNITGEVIEIKKGL